MMTLVFGMSAQEVCAKEKVDDHLSLEMQVEQNTDENSVNVKIAVQNTGSGQVENLKISGSIPAGMEISDNQSNSLEVETSAPGTREELEYSLVVSSEDDENINDNTKPSDTPNDNSSNDTGTKDVYWSSFLVTLCSEIMLYIETPLVSYSYSLNEVSHSCTS